MKTSHCIRNLVIAGAVVALSASCDRTPLEVIDKTIPTGISISFSDNAESWEINTTRTVSLTVTPDKAIPSSMGLNVSSDIIKVEPTDCPCRYVLTATATGNVTISAYADDVKSESKSFTVIDSSIPEKVSIQMDKTESEWELNSSRRIIINTSPIGTKAKKYGIVSSDEGVLKVFPTDEANVFDIKAVGGGEASLYAFADELKTSLYSFKVPFPDVKPEPEITVYVKKVGTQAAKDKYGSYLLVKYGEQYLVSASCNRKDLTLEMYSSDEKVATFSDFGENEWLVSATFPGQTDLQVYVVDDGKEYVSSHEFVVYGEVTFQAECTPVFCVAGFSVVDNPFGSLTADIHIDMTLVGWPHNNETKKLRMQVPSYDTRNFSIAEDGEYPMMYDFKETSDKMYNTWTGGAIGSGDYYCPHGAELNYVFKLNNSYITVKMLDDPNGEKNWQFYTKAAAQTTGVVSYE